MLELFYSPGACSLVTHIALEEAGEPFQPMRVTLMHGEHLTAEFLEINPRARVPALVTDNGVVTENLAILNLIGDLYGKDGSVPKEPFEAARCNELLGWFSSSVHIPSRRCGAASASPTTRSCSRRSRKAASERSKSSLQKSSNCQAKAGLPVTASLPQTAMRWSSSAGEGGSAWTWAAIRAGPRF